MKKLVSISGKDWMRGISLQTQSQIGGIFRQASLYDPFEMMGYMRPTLQPTRYGSGTITKTIKYMVGAEVSGDSVILSYADGGGATHLYKTLTNNGTTTDESSSITSSASARGLIKARNRVIYALTTTIRSLANDLSGNTEILTGLTDGEHPMVVGADLNVYGIDGGTAANNIFKIVLATGTSGNTISVFALEPGMFVRDIKNDGRYLVMVADNRTTVTSGSIGSFNCVCAYWDYTSGTLTQRFDFMDSAINGLAVQNDGSCVIFGGKQNYVVSVGTPPTPILPLSGQASITGYPSGPGMIAKKDGAILFGDSQSNRIYAYGRAMPGQQKIWYQPYATDNDQITAIIENFGQVWAATDGSDVGTPGLYGFWDGDAGRQTVFIATSPIIFPKPYRIQKIRVVAKDQLASGETMNVEVLANSNIVSAEQTFSYAVDGEKQSRVFDILPSTNTVPICNEIGQIQIQSNCTLSTIELWGEEVDPLSQTI